MKMSLNELRIEIAEILSEAKKKKVKKSDKIKKNAGEAASAYGFYDEALDFSEALGEDNIYAQQGAVNWGPNTSAGKHTDTAFNDPHLHNMSESDDRALRSLVKEVMQLGNISENSVWNVIDESEESTNIWEAANRWYEKYGDGINEKVKKGKAFENTKYKLNARAQNAAAPKK
jgi:hypothetical protein